jgi:hypothetical protein
VLRGNGVVPWANSIESGLGILERGEQTRWDTFGSGLREQKGAMQYLEMKQISSVLNCSLLARLSG